MTDEVEVVAEELAEAGGTTWSGREQGTVMRVVSDSYRDRARVAIAALERFRSSRELTCSQDNTATDIPQASDAEPRFTSGEPLQLGLTVAYRPPGDQRAYTCRVVQVEGSRAYLAPILKACTAWISIERLLPSRPETASSHRQEEVWAFGRTKALLRIEGGPGTLLG